MTKYQTRILAKQIIEEKMGLKMSNNDVILLEANETDGEVDRILFYRRGFANLQYEAVKFTHTWKLTLLGMQTQEEITL